ncbi:hypothetical protein OG698_09795 [Streptomyces sp. NBC_01003]|nr:hypothetical protein OG698_09795 [Streptomyces sp. NBC_01003]
MELALRDAGLAPADIGLVHAHATSTESGTAVFMDVVGRRFDEIRAAAP